MHKYKLVIVVRTDLNLSVGKLSAQVAHAAVSCVLKCKKRRLVSEWVKEGQRKIVVKVDSLDKLYELESIGKREKLTTVLISDAGLTEIPKGTITCLGLGPALAEHIDKITGNLPLA